MPKTHHLLKETSKGSLFVFNSLLTRWSTISDYICIMITRSITLEHKKVTLTILVSEDLSMWSGGVGFFEVIGIKDICWDNLEYFSKLPFKKFKEDFEQEELKSFEELGYNLKGVHKSIKKLLKDAERLFLLHGSREESLREVVKYMLSEETDEDIIQNYVDSIKMIFSERFDD